MEYILFLLLIAVFELLFLILIKLKSRKLIQYFREEKKRSI